MDNNNSSSLPGGSGVSIRGGDAVQVKAAAAAARAETTRKVAQLRQLQEQAKADLEAQRKQMEFEFNQKKAELEAQLAPMQAELAKLVEVSWTVDLYLGRDETLHLIRDGEPAPADTPVTIRQKVLSMAEESLVMLGSSSQPVVRDIEGMNSDDLPDFIAWLTSDDANLNRVLPEPKGVVVLVPTWVESKTGNIYEDAARNEANRTSYWLLRNGERIHLLTVDPHLRVGKNLLPLRDEFVELFEQRLLGHKLGDLQPGSDEWLEMEARADARKRHFMRVMLTLQGVVDRTTVWHPLPPAGLNLMHVSSQDEGKVRIIADADLSRQLGDGREPFAKWQHRLNSLLRPGLRLIGNFGIYRESEHGTRIQPPNAGSPKSGVPYLVEGRRDGGVVIRFDRGDVWKRNVPIPDKPGWVYREQLVPATRRASMLIRPNDDFVLPYDLATVADLEYYLNSRESRSRSLLTMAPTIHAALAAKKAEAEQEAPFRVLLAGALIAEGADPNSVDTDVDDLVHWWKIANTWARPLNGEPKHETRAVKAIVAEYRTRRRAAGADTGRIVAAAKTLPGLVAVGCNRQGRWFAYSASAPAHDPGVFVDVTPVSAAGVLGETSRWQKLQQRTATALQVVWQAPEWASWLHHANPNHYLTGPERDRLVAEAVSRIDGPLLAVVEHFDPADPAVRLIGTYEWCAGTRLDAAAAFPSRDPLSWRRSGEFVKMRAWRVVKDRTGARIEPLTGRSELKSSFATFSGGSRWGDTPWWPEETHRCPNPRPRLVHADETNLDLMRGWVDECGRLAEAEAAEVRARRARIDSVVDAVEKVLLDRVIDEAKARFVDDFGWDAMDLWPNHLKSLNLRSPIRRNVLVDVISAVDKAGSVVVGRSLDEVADEAVESAGVDRWGRAATRVDLAGFGDVTIPDPDADDDAEPMP